MQVPCCCAPAPDCVYCDDDVAEYDITFTGITNGTHASNCTALNATFRVTRVDPDFDLTPCSWTGLVGDIISGGGACASPDLLLRIQPVGANFRVTVTFNPSGAGIIQWHKDFDSYTGFPDTTALCLFVAEDLPWSGITDGLGVRCCDATSSTCTVSAV